MKWTGQPVWLGALAMLAALSPAGAQDVAVSGRIVLVGSAARRNPAGNSNAVVWLTPLEAASSLNEIPVSLGQQHLRVVQKNKRFIPHILVVPVGSVVEFPNLDPFFHNVFSLFEGKRFDLRLYEAGTTRSVNFTAPGICYIFCNIHPEMSAVVVVLRTPYYAVSNASGDVTISHVPPGRYELHVWQERCLPEILKNATREVTLREASESFGAIRLTESENLAVSHKNKYSRDYDSPIPANALYDQL